MIPGYNHNVKYKERIFHVQTEDSGIKNPHIITLLYYGGNILESVKSSYADRVAQASAPDFGANLSVLMQKQHKDVLKGLITGRFDLKIDQRSANASFLNGPAPLNVAEGSQHQASGFGGVRHKAAPTAAPAAAVPASAGKVTPLAAPLPARTPEKAPQPASDGAFSTTGGSMLDAMAQAVPTLDADTLRDALEKGDDNSIFGDGDSKGLDAMMLDFLKG